MPPPPVIQITPLAPRDSQSPRDRTTGSSKTRKRVASSSHNNNNVSRTSSAPTKKAKENTEVIHLKTEIAFDSTVVVGGHDDGGLFGRDDEGIEEVQLIGACENTNGNILPSSVQR